MPIGGQVCVPIDSFPQQRQAPLYYCVFLMKPLRRDAEVLSQRDCCINALVSNVRLMAQLVTRWF